MPEQEVSPERQAQAHWHTEYEFWHKIITEEVERRRFNDGYEPIRVELFPATESSGAAFVGQTRIGHQLFTAVARSGRLPDGSKVLKLEILVRK